MDRGHRVRLRAVISTYHAAAPVDGPHYDTAANTLATILAGRYPASKVIGVINDAIGEAPSEDVRVLLHAARDRVIGDRITVARAGNDAINARLVRLDHSA